MSRSCQRFVVAALLCPTAITASFGQANPPTKAPDLKPVKVTETEYRLGTLSFDSKSREIWFPARVNQADEGVLLEYAVSEEVRGKLHEALLSTKTSPFEIQIAMKLLRWEASGRDLYRDYDDDGKPIGELKDDGKGRMEILIRHAGKDGGEVTEPIGNWMQNTQSKAAVGAGAWTYTGSKVIEGYFLAEEDGAIAAVYRYEGAMCNAFHPGSDDDELWFPYPKRVPAVGTELTVVLRPLPDEKIVGGAKKNAGTTFNEETD